MLDKKALKVIDWYVHPSHQYELFKLGHTFYFLREEGAKSWSIQCRPKPYNCHFINSIIPDEFDLVIAHKTNHMNMIKIWQEGGFIDPKIPIIFIFHYQPVSEDIKDKMIPVVKDCHLIFNSYQSQLSWNMPNKSQRTIIHGFDIDEWGEWQGGVKGVLTVAGRMGQRRYATGYPFWYDAVTKLEKYIDIRVMGSSWDNLEGWERDIVRHSKDWQDLKDTMKEFDVYFSPTYESPFPRARTEAFVTGMPMVTTGNHDVNIYIEDGINGFIVDEPKEATERIHQLLGDEDLRKRFSRNAREKAREVMGIDRYLKEWTDLLDFILGRY